MHSISIGFHLIFNWNFTFATGKFIEILKLKIRIVNFIINAWIINGKIFVYIYIKQNSYIGKFSYNYYGNILY